MDNYYTKEGLGISQRALDLIEMAEKSAILAFNKIDKISEQNQVKVLKAFYDNKIGEAHFISTSGYGYNDIGRDAIDRLYAQAFGCDVALVRHTMVSGTHALSTALFAVLRPGDTLLSITGKPYDTLEEVIGIRGERGNGSLADFGVKYRQAELKEDGSIDYDTVKSLIDSKTKAVLIQRSKGYGWRKSLSADQITKAVEFVKRINPNTICIVDNCYGEFSQAAEPKADMLVGSLIKNPGGGIAQTGGYIAGKKDYVTLAADRLTAVGIGRECGASLGQNKPMIQGLFMAPHTVAQALKAAVLCASVFESLGFEVSPDKAEERCDIIQAIKFGKKELLIAFCRGIQKGAPVDSFVTPEPWDMPGYTDQVIMAAGAFVQGASIELSADAPIKEPYIVYMQGGLTYESAKYGILMAVDNVLKVLSKQ